MSEIYYSLGEIRGTIIDIDNNACQATIKNYQTGNNIKILFDLQHLDGINRLLKHKAWVSGKIKRSRTTGAPQEIKLEKIKPVNINSVDIEDVAGILGRQWCGGLDPVDWVRQQRD